jgi:hypothetical protein
LSHRHRPAPLGLAAIRCPAVPGTFAGCGERSEPHQANQPASHNLIHPLRNHATDAVRLRLTASYGPAVPVHLQDAVSSANRIKPPLRAPIRFTRSAITRPMRCAGSGAFVGCGERSEPHQARRLRAPIPIRPPRNHAADAVATSAYRIPWSSRNPSCRAFKRVPRFIPPAAGFFPHHRTRLGESHRGRRRHATHLAQVQQASAPAGRGDPAQVIREEDQ